MEIKSCTDMNRDNIKMEDLSVLKEQIKLRIEEQKEKLEYSAKNLFPTSPLKIVSTVSDVALAASGIMKGTKRAGKGFALINSVVIGYKLVKNIRKSIRSRFGKK